MEIYGNKYNWKISSVGATRRSLYRRQFKDLCQVFGDLEKKNNLSLIVGAGPYARPLFPFPKHGGAQRPRPTMCDGICPLN